MDSAELIGKRILVAANTGRYNSTNVEEWRFLELSPSKKWVKAMNANGKKFWKPFAEVTVIEVLVPLEPSPEGDSNGEG